MKKRILIVIDSLGAGGAERVALNLAEALQKEGCSLTIITVDNIVSYDLNEEILYKSLAFEKGFLDYYRYEKRLHKMIDTLQEDEPFEKIIVHLQKSTRLMKNYQHPKVIHVVHSTLSQASLSGRSGLRKSLKVQRLKAIYDGLNIVAVSKGIADDIQAIGIVPKTLKVIYNPIDVEVLKQKAREESPCLDEEYIVYVGRLAASKRHDRALEAYKKSGVNEKLLIVGEGEMREKIEENIKRLELENKVVLCGFQSNPYAIIKRAKLLILTSDYEGLPTVLIEALSLGVPVISTDCPSGPREILQEDMPDALVGVDDTAGLAKQIHTFVHAAPKISLQLIERFNAQKIAKAYLQHL